MGKAFKWFRGLLGLKKPDPPFTPSPSKRKHKSFKDKNKLRHRDALTPSLAVVKLPSNGQTVPITAVHTLTFHEADFAATKIQAAFRGFLARKALRALRGLVRLQALVRGHIERKRTAEWIQRMQALLRAQTRARAGWSRSASELLHSDIKFSSFSSPAATNPFSCETQSFSPFEFLHEVEESSFFPGTSTKKNPVTPTSTRSYFIGDSEYPSYMACTESSRAKMRSHSVPRQHPQYERSSSAKRSSIYVVEESRSSELQVSRLQSNFVGKAYLGSGLLDKHGMPVSYRY
ncbi:uncharacterized protein LOC111468912 [Cucurbita maxima]|uniref:Uncharacterized protein LOC111468912 n=1 Tax=Cucurbita maxima TaxID=3661 RepID=A0A6J1I3T0_CUCMA|nr:uncharacterized protein LOC111468912 [Cucurbita maxima]